MPVEIGQVLESRLIADHRDRLICCIKHGTGLPDTDTVQKFKKTIASDLLEIAGKGSWAHTGKVCRHFQRHVFGKMLGDVVHHLCNADMFAAVLGPEDSSKHIRIAQVVDHITKHFAEDMSLEMAADLACMSPTAFSRNFQKITGNRFLEFLNRVRVGQACSMLYATDQPVSVICYEAGFQNLANFNRHFMKMKNMTPTAYRALARVELAKKEAASR